MQTHTPGASIVTCLPALAGLAPSLGLARTKCICYANCDGSTALPVLTSNDFQCYLNAFAAGCS